MVTPNEDRRIAELEEAWQLVDELGELSLRLRNAAIAARHALGLPEERPTHDHPAT